MKIAIIRFPGSNCDFDCGKAIEHLGWSAQYVWHTDSIPEDIDGAILPGGFSYGDAIRPGVLAHFSPAVTDLKNKAIQGFPILGICNGMQILCESGLLPGVLDQNKSAQFFCGEVELTIDKTTACWFTQEFKHEEKIKLPVAHGYGRWLTSHEYTSVTLKYSTLPQKFFDNGSTLNVAGICNHTGNVFGLMPHPERAVFPWMSSQDGIKILKGFSYATRR